MSQQQQQQQKQQQQQEYLKRKRCLDKIHSFCQLKNWCLAELAYEEYVALCQNLWKKYDTHFNYGYNICGNCRQMKHAVVKNRWSDSELYPIYGQLVCINKLCEFQLVINTDKKWIF